MTFNKLYKHRSTLDMIIHVLRVVKDTTDSIKVKVFYLNTKKQPLYDRFEIVTIKKADLDKWREFKV